METRRGRTRAFVFSLVLFCFATLLSGAEGQPPTSQHQSHGKVSADPQEAVLHSHLHLVNELSERRRLNVFFRNEQSVSHGVPVRFVNSSKGNLTFVRRDLVAIGRIPIVLARAYDSAGPGTVDFGPGWRLTLAETIVSRRNGSLVYTDDSGSEWILIRDGSGRFVVKPMSPTDIAYAEQLERGISVVHRNGWTKTFQAGAAGFQLAEIADPYGNALRLSYSGDALERISGDNGRLVAIERDNIGRVNRVSDDQGRSATYHYSKDGRLLRSIDIGGNAWSYQYDQAGRLKRALDPRDNELLLATYGARGQANVVEILGARYRYEYKTGVTSIQDDADRITRIEHNALGIATAITNAEGLRSEVRLDSHNRLKTLLHNGKPVAGFLYDSAGRVSSIRHHNGDSTVDLSVARNMENGATRIAGSDRTSVETVTNTSGGLLRRSGAQGTYEYSPKGDLKAVTQDGRTTTYSHNADGQVETITDPNGTAVLNYYPDGKVRSIQFHDGSVHEYNHSTLGFRKSIKRNDGSVKTFEYDVAGNLIRTDGPNADGQSADQRVELDKYHRPKHIDYSDGKRLSVTYDAQGNPLTVRQWFPGSNKQALALSPEEVSRSEPNVFEYLYDATNRIVAVQVGDTISGTHEYTDAEPDLRNQHDHKTMRASAATIRQSASIGDLSSILYARPTGSFFDVVRYDETLRMFEVPAAGISMPDAVAVNSVLRRSLPEGRSAERVQERIAFDQASNVIFLPPEYDTINCVPPNCVFIGIKISGNGVYNSVSVPAGSTVSFHATKQKASQCQQGVLYSLYAGATPIGYNFTGQATHFYPNPGTYWASASGECNGCDVFGSASIQVVVTQPPCSVPTNFRQTSASDIGNGHLQFEYEWDSSTGSLAHLSQCFVGEIVDYPDSQNPWPYPSPPFPAHSVPNPTVIDLPGDEGGFTDTHSLPAANFVQPYSSTTVTAVQRYRYRCPCASGGAYINIGGSLSIVRRVSPSGAAWRYSITKPTGGQATIDPLP